MPERSNTARTARRAYSGARIYSVHPSVAHFQVVRDKLTTATGRSLAEWVRLARTEGPSVDTERVAWLRKEHNLNATTAWIISEAVEGRQTGEADLKAYLRRAPEYVEAMYAGPKAGLRPIHDALIQFSRSLGADVRICPSERLISLYREHVIAEIRPATRTRIELGLALRGAKREPDGRFVETTGSAKGGRITHRIAIHSIEEIDDEVRGWVRAAYDLDR
jgi:hypothetical protein